MSFRRYIAVIVVLLMLVAVAVLVIVAVFRRDDPLAVGEEWPINVAHRGASAAAPENTIEAFREARRSGAGGLETDVHLSSDGHLAVIHDEMLGRTTSGSGAVRHNTLAKLRSLDAGYHFVPGGIPEEGIPDSDSVEYPYRDQGVRIPTLREVLEQFPEMTVNVDIKEDQPGIERAVLEEIDSAGARNRVLVASQDGGVISRFRSLSDGEIATAASKWEVARFYGLSLLRLESLSNPPYESLQVPVRYAGIEFTTDRFLDAAHSRGVRVDVWTIDEPGEMSRLLNLGADSIMTDRPGALQRVLESRDGESIEKGG